MRFNTKICKTGQRVLILLLAFLVLFLSGCKGGKWDEAYGYYSKKQFQEAYTIFSTLGNYKSSEKFARNSKLMIDIETARTMIENSEYGEALALLRLYADDGVDNTYESITIRNADDTAADYIQICEMALAGTFIDAFTIRGNDLSGTIYLADSIESPRLELVFSANNEHYQGKAYVADFKAYGEIPHFEERSLQEFQTEGGFEFNNVNISGYNFTITDTAVFFGNDIFDPVTASDIWILSLSLKLNTAISVDGRYGYAPVDDINNVKFSNLQEVFKNGELTVRLFAGDDVFLERTFSIVD